MINLKKQLKKNWQPSRQILKKSATSFYNAIKSRHSIKSVFSYLPLLYKEYSAQPTQPNAAIKINTYKTTTLRLSLNKSTHSALKTLSSLNKSTLAHNFLLSEQSLYSLINALWRVYYSNNLRLSQSFFRLINLITDHHFKLTKLIPAQEIFYNNSAFYRFLTKYETKLRSFLPSNTTTISRFATLNTFSYSNIKNQSLSLHQNQNQNLKLVKGQGLFALSSTIPILSKIYETIESNYMFYNASSYQSVKTLHRLTNSLWKIYSGHNLELSRNLVNLINTITEKNKTLKTISSFNSFNTTASLYSLVSALKRAFLGNNIHLRHSMLSLFSDINRLTAPQNHAHNKHTTILLHPTFIHQSTKPTPLLHSIQPTQNTNNSLERQMRQYIDQKLKDSHVQKINQSDNEAIIKTVLKRLKDEQAEQWRIEKLQRGLF